MTPDLGGPRGARCAPGGCSCSEAFAFAAGRAEEAGVVQGEGFARQQRLALQAGKVLLVPGQPFCLLVVLREDDLGDRQTDKCLFPPSGQARAGRVSPTPPTVPISPGGQAAGRGE